MPVIQRPAQTLLELVLAASVIVIATLTTTTVIVTTITAGSFSQTRVEAANLAREGAEVVRMVRDSNWLKIDANEATDGNPTLWNAGLPDTSTAVCYQAEFSPSAGWTLAAITCPTPGNAPVIAVSNNQYLTQNCTAGCVPTKFRRVITVEKLTDTVTVGTASEPIDYLRVRSRVEWNERTGIRSSTVETRLYNWK